MERKVFIDTNIILDIFLKRELFFDLSQEVIVSVVENDYIPYVSGSSITDLYYICKKAGMQRETILEHLKKLLDVFEVVIIDKESINNAILSDIKDFEDAVQITACRDENIDLIITRNVKDFENDWIKIQTPQQFIESC